MRDTRPNEMHVGTRSKKDIQNKPITPYFRMVVEGNDTYEEEIRSGKIDPNGDIVKTILTVAGLICPTTLRNFRENVEYPETTLRKYLKFLSKEGLISFKCHPSFQGKSKDVWTVALKENPNEKRLVG